MRRCFSVLNLRASYDPGAYSKKFLTKFVPHFFRVACGCHIGICGPFMLEVLSKNCRYAGKT